MGSKKSALIVALVLLVITLAGIYMVVVPIVLSRQYIVRVDGSVRSLVNDFKALDKSTELPFISDSSASGETKKQNATYITQLIKDARQKLVTVKKEDSSLRPMPYSDVLGQYDKAFVLHDHVQRFLGQTEGALDDYGALISYLVTYNGAVDDAATRLNDFNTVSDLNEYVGQADAVREIAVALRSDADQLAKTTPPAGTGNMSNSTIRALDAAAGGFDALADGLAIPADDPIYAAAHEIEGAASELDKVSSTDYDGILDQSRTIKNIQDFSEKLDLVLET